MGWIGVDFDGTLAEYHKWEGSDKLGAPIQPMVQRVKQWLDEGKEVRIFTARAYPITKPIYGDAGFNLHYIPNLGEGIEEALMAIEAIREWTYNVFGRILTVTCVKDHAMIELYDDRAIQVTKNTGEIVGYSTRGNA